MTADAMQALIELQKVRAWRNGTGGKLPYDFLFGTDNRDRPENIAYIDIVEAALRAHWQPIETAPKDGTSIIIGHVDGWMTMAHWREDKGGQWFVNGGFFIDQKPTHWQLPKPPTRAQ